MGLLKLGNCSHKVIGETMFNVVFLNVANALPKYMLFSKTMIFLRTQLGKYWHIKDGKFQEKLTDLLPFDWDDMVTFYLGCSFGMEDSLEDAGIKFPAKNKNVPMYITNIPCSKSGPFSTNMVVSMRSVPKDLLQALFEATHTLDCSHGAPVHIGDPRDIGISDTQRVDFGEPVTVAEDEVPVFFACGVTGNKAIESAGKSIIFTYFCRV